MFRDSEHLCKGWKTETKNSTMKSYLQCLSSHFCKKVNIVTNYFSNILGIPSIFSIRSISVDSAANFMESGITRSDFPTQREHNSHRPINKNCSVLSYFVTAALVVTCLWTLITCGYYGKWQDICSYSLGAPLGRLCLPTNLSLEDLPEEVKILVPQMPKDHAQNNVVNFFQVHQTYH